MTELIKEDICIVLDVEFSSSNIITESILQLGFVAIKKNCSAYDLENNESWIVDKLSVCFDDRDKIKEDGVMNFWATFPQIYDRIKSESVSLEFGMRKVQEWLNELYENYNIVKFISDPAVADFPWFRCLYLKYCDQSLNKFPRLPHKCFDLDTVYELLADTHNMNKKDIINSTDTTRFQHTHYALDDAIKTAYEYLKLKQLFNLTKI